MNVDEEPLTGKEPRIGRQKPDDSPMLGSIKEPTQEEIDNLGEAFQELLPLQYREDSTNIDYMTIEEETDLSRINQWVKSHAENLQNLDKINRLSVSRTIFLDRTESLEFSFNNLGFWLKKEGDSWILKEAARSQGIENKYFYRLATLALVTLRQLPPKEAFNEKVQEIYNLINNNPSRQRSTATLMSGSGYEDLSVAGMRHRHSEDLIEVGVNQVTFSKDDDESEDKVKYMEEVFRARGILRDKDDLRSITLRAFDDFESGTRRDRAGEVFFDMYLHDVSETLGTIRLRFYLDERLLKFAAPEPSPNARRKFMIDWLRDLEEKHKRKLTEERQVLVKMKGRLETINTGNNTTKAGILRELARILNNGPLPIEV